MSFWNVGGWWLGGVGGGGGYPFVCLTTLGLYSVHCLSCIVSEREFMSFERFE